MSDEDSLFSEVPSPLEIVLSDGRRIAALER